MTGLLTSQLLVRKDTAANWTSANPILLQGEIGQESDTLFHKIGDDSPNPGFANQVIITV